MRKKAMKRIQGLTSEKPDIDGLTDGYGDVTMAEWFLVIW